MLSKKGFVERLALKGYSKKDATIVVNDFIDTLTECLAEEEDVHFTGFGTFIVRNMKPKTIKTFNGDIVESKPFKSPKFQSSETLRRIVREGMVRPK